MGKGEGVMEQHGYEEEEELMSYFDGVKTGVGGGGAMKRDIWVVEQFGGRKWWPCEDAKLLKKDALWKQKVWEAPDPEGKYRVTKYIPAKK